MNIFNENEDAPAFAIGLFMGAILVSVIVFVASNPIDEPSAPTKVCKDGKLYEVTHEGNITIFDRRDFMTCEEK